MIYKQIELVNKSLDNLTINLRVLHEMQQIQQIAVSFERQTQHFQPQDPKRNDLNENPIMKQFSRINEIRSLLQNYAQSVPQQ
jgi:division protein CdvB (Snf7/Vps24/ESCRT-III family)